MEQMIENALEYLVDLGKNSLQTKTVHEHEDIAHVLIAQKPNEAPLLQQFSKPRTPRSHTFETDAGFLAFLNSDHCKNLSIGGRESKGVVFTGAADKIVADLDYGIHPRIAQRAMLKLDATEEYIALTKLLNKNGLTQRELWSLLVSELHNCIDPALLLAIGSIQMTKDEEKTAKIDVSGFSNRTERSGWSMTWGTDASKKTNSYFDWEWKGRIWNCFDYESIVALRLEINNDEGVRFIFHARRLQKVLIDARAALNAHIAAGLPEHFQCYQAIIG